MENRQTFPYVEFKRVAIEDKRRSNELGYRVTKDEDFAYIMQPGAKDIFERNAEDWLKSIETKSRNQAHDAFPIQVVEQYKLMYERWKAGEEAPVNGTRIAEWPMISPAQAENFKALRIMTVEDVATMNEESIMRIGMGARDLRDKAAQWLKKREGIDLVLSENESLKKQLAEMAERMNALEEKSEAVETEDESVQKITIKRRGRRPLEKIEADIKDAA